MKTNKLVIVAILSAVAVVVNLIENWFIPPVAFGIRFGIANIVSLVVLKKFGIKEMTLVVILRLTIGNLLKGQIFGTPFWISTGGLILSSIIIVILDKLNASIMFTSMMSALFHTTGQVIAVCILYDQVNIIAMLPVLIIGSVATGVLTGIISRKVIERVKI